MPLQPTPEQPTLTERLILLFPLPFVVGCIVFGFVLVEIVPTFVAEYTETASVIASLEYAFNLQNLLNSPFIPYLFYATHYMRLRLLKSENTLSRLLPGGEEEFHRLFGRVSAVKPQLATWGAVSIVLLVEVNVLPILLPSVSNQPSGPKTPLGQTAFEITSFANFLITTLVVSSLAWVYYSTLKGIHRMGSAALNFPRFYRDPFLGLKPVGSLALALATAYFGLEGLFIVTGFASPPTAVDLIVVGGVLLGLVIIGILAFFLPLRKLHACMSKQKALERANLSDRFARIVDAEQVEQDAPEVLTVDLLDRKVSQIATWPFDFSILGKLTIITLSVAAALLTRVLVTFLHL